MYYLFRDTTRLLQEDSNTFKFFYYKHLKYSIFVKIWKKVFGLSRSFLIHNFAYMDRALRYLFTSFNFRFWMLLFKPPFFVVHQINLKILRIFFVSNGYVVFDKEIICLGMDGMRKMFASHVWLGWIVEHQSVIYWNSIPR